MNVTRDTDTKEQEQVYNVEFEIWSMKFAKHSTKCTCDNSDAIFLPKFETQRMFSQRHRKLSSKTAKTMLTWDHYRFSMQLLDKARKYLNCHVIICSEEYTSKTCSECEYIHTKLACAKRFKCSGCKHKSNRDFNAAQIVLLKNMRLIFD